MLLGSKFHKSSDTEPVVNLQNCTSHCDWAFPVQRVFVSVHSKPPAICQWWLALVSKGFCSGDTLVSFLITETEYLTPWWRWPRVSYKFIHWISVVKVWVCHRPCLMSQQFRWGNKTPYFSDLSGGVCDLGCWNISKDRTASQMRTLWLVKSSTEVNSNSREK